MLQKLLVLFVVVPLLELTLLLIIAHLTHFLFSVALVIVTGMIGAWLARRQGLAVIRRMREKAAKGEMPTDSLLDAGLILFAGGMLLTPGVFTDIFGMSLLIPRCRGWYKTRLVNWFHRNFQISSIIPGASFNDPSVVDSYAVHPDETVPNDELDSKNNSTDDSSGQFDSPPERIETLDAPVTGRGSIPKEPD